jgi:hypothetical protein
MITLSMCELWAGTNYGPVYGRPLNLNFRKENLPMRFRSFIVIAVSIIASNCTPTTIPQPGGVANTACGFSPNQTSNGLSLTCTVTGPVPNLRVDPLVAGNAPCGLNSWTIFEQTVNTPMVAIYGENGDDNNVRVRVGVTLGPGTHAGKMAKDNTRDNCNSTVGPVFAINTSYTGNHVALVDKSRSPMCIFQSRLVLSSFNQTLTAGVPLNISGMTRNGTQDALHKRIDLEIAKAVNGLLNSAAMPLSNEVVGRSGRCENDWHQFTGS